MTTITQPESSPSPAGPSSAVKTGYVLSTPLAALLAIVTTLIGIVVLAWSVLYITKGRFLKAPFERIAGGMADRSIVVGGDFQLYFDPFDLKFVAEDMTVSNPAWAGPRNFYEGALIDARVKTFASLFGKTRVEHLVLRDSAIDLEWSRDGKRNTWTFGPQPAEPFEIPVIERGEVSGTTLRYRDPRMLIAADIKVETVRAEDTRFANAVRFSGSGRARTTPFTLSGALLSPNQALAGGKNQLELNIAAARTRARIWGTLPGATEIEGADLNLDVRGRNLADLFAVGGIVVPETRAYRVRSALTKAGDEWRFTRIAGRYGASDLGGWLTVKMTEPRLLLTAELSTRNLAMVDVAPFVGYDPQKVAAGGAQAAVPQTGGRPRLLPDAPMNVAALSNFDANVKYTVRNVVGDNVPISNAELTLTLDDRLLKLAPFNFTMARGRVLSDITIDARRSPIFTDYDIRLTPTPLNVLLAGWGVDESGTSGTLKARIKMTGTGNSVRSSLASSNGRIAVILPKGVFWTRNIQLAELDVGTFAQKAIQKQLKNPVQINCGLIGFTVRNGVAAADPILIDTNQSVVAARGGFSFRTEAIDLAIRADSKRFSLFSGQSPVGINGYFAQPGLAIISPQLLTRAGAGLGLGLVASPLAGLLAFVDIGDAKAADCGPVLQGASAAAQRTTKGKARKDVGKGTADVEEPKREKKFLGIL